MAEGSIEKGFILDPEAKMQSRIDEQSELICILKKRADQLLTESKMSFHFDACLWLARPLANPNSPVNINEKTIKV